MRTSVIRKALVAFLPVVAPPAGACEFEAVYTDLQWVSNPGASRDIDDAFVAGLRIELSW